MCADRFRQTAEASSFKGRNGGWGKGGGGGVVGKKVVRELSVVTYTKKPEDEWGQ